MIKLSFLGNFYQDRFRTVCCCNDDQARQPFFVSVTLYMCDRVYEGPRNRAQNTAVRNVEQYRLWLLYKFTGQQATSFFLNYIPPSCCEKGKQEVTYRTKV